MKGTGRGAHLVSTRKQQTGLSHQAAAQFADEPDELADHIVQSVLPGLESGRSRLVAGLLPYLEDEAIRRMRQIDLNHDWDTAQERATEPELWRSRWVCEARYFLRSPTVQTIGPEIAAAEVLCRLSELRLAIDNGEAERAAALGMLVASWVYVGGVSIRRALAELVASGFKRKQKARAKKPRTTIETDEGRTRKRDVIQQALRDAGPGARTPEVWPYLMHILVRIGRQPQETGAKDKRAIVVDGKTFTTFKSVQKTIGELRKKTGSKTEKGRPKKKPL